MAPKRKASEAELTQEEVPEQTSTKATTPTSKSPSTEPQAQVQTQEEPEETTTPSQTAPTTNPNGSATSDARAARFAALKARAASSSASNLTAARLEATRASIDPSQLTSLSRRHAIASHNLLKAEHDSPEAFERKRAWDWTIDESEKWDKRMAKKEKHREEVAFRNYGDEAGKVYRRQMREMAKTEAKKNLNSNNGETSHTAGAAADDDEDRLTAYESTKLRNLLSAAQSGNLELVENGSGELVFLDRHNSATSLVDDRLLTHQQSHTPSRTAIDRLVSDLRKAEEKHMKNRRDRQRANDERDEAGDITFINDDNKKFNNKLRRFYDRYTKEIRDGFERGTAL